MKDSRRLENEAGISKLPSLDTELLAVAVNSAAVGVAITDARLPDNPVIYINTAFTRMTGYETEDIIGLNCRFLQGAETDPAAVNRIRGAIATRERFTQILLNYSKAGRAFWNELTIAPVFDAEGVATHFIGFQMDVTARIEAEARARSALVETQKARAEAERANAAKSEFLSRMSHELRTPLNSVLGFSQLLEMDDLEEQQLEQVAYILTAGRHLLALIDEVLDLARVEAGRLVLTSEAVPIHEIVDETLSIVKPLAWPRNISLSAEEIPAAAIVWADRQRLQQVLLNLVSNAIKYNRSDGTVVVRCHEDNSGAAPCWRLEISDTGAGVPEDKRAKLFQPFERLGADKSEVEGTGLGLAVSKRMMEAMGGEIGLEPHEIGVGSTFWVNLPALTDEKEAHSHEIAADSMRKAASTPQPTLRKVLYIEDNSANFHLVKSALERIPGLTLLSAEKAMPGLQMARDEQPQLILLDLDLPDLSGEEALVQLQADERTAGIPIFVVSADATALTIERLRRAGVRDYFTKPLDVRPFMAAVSEVLGLGGEASNKRTFE